MRALSELEARLRYEFSDKTLAQEALKHRSAGRGHNERLEFLGDAFLDLVISHYLHTHVPDANEGDLSRLRASLVRRETLAKIATELELGEFVVLGSGELRSGGFRRKSILADALEALLGAIYLDAGYQRASQWLELLYAERLAQLPDPETLRDPKSRLQEFLQARSMPPPTYTLQSAQGEPHQQTFSVSCVIPGLGIDAEGQGSSRRRAEQAAASAALNAMRETKT